MKHPAIPRTLIPLLLTALFLSACGAESSQPITRPPLDTEDTAESTTADLKTHIAELQAAILALKEENYITKAEYEARINALLSEIAALEAQLNLPDLPADTDVPVSGYPTEPPPDTQKPTEKPLSMAFQYEIRDGRAVITAYLGDEPRVSIPLTIEGYPVTTIADNAFQNTAVVSVALPYSITEIGWFAFAGCGSLAEVTLPASVESIGYGAFDGCPALIIRCPAGSYASDYAVSFGLKHTHT